MTLRQFITLLSADHRLDQEITCIRVGAGKNFCSSLYPDAKMVVEIDDDIATPVDAPDSLEIVIHG